MNFLPTILFVCYILKTLSINMTEAKTLGESNLQTVKSADFFGILGINSEIFFSKFKINWRSATKFTR